MFEGLYKRLRSESPCWWKDVGRSLVLYAAAYSLVAVVAVLVFRLMAAILCGEGSLFIDKTFDAVGHTSLSLKIDVYLAGVALTLTLSVLARLLEKQASRFRLFCDGGSRGWQ